ncbi:hypothetical protein N2152v2_007694 [Parachlorella kessleri]
MGLFGCFNGLSRQKLDTSSRTGLMLKEASDFQQRLKKAEGSFKALDKSAAAALEVSGHVMASPLPRVIQDPAQAAASADPIGGTAFDATKVANLRVELGHKMQADVFAPLQQWVANHKDAVTKQKDVDRAKAEMESWRNKSQGQASKVDALRAKAGDAKAQAKLEGATKTLQSHETQLTTATAHYQEVEARQHAKLVSLIRDAVYLRAYIRTALATEGQALVAAAESMPMILPGQASEAASAAAVAQAGPAPLPAATEEQAIDGTTGVLSVLPVVQVEPPAAAAAPAPEQPAVSPPPQQQQAYPLQPLRSSVMRPQAGGATLQPSPQAVPGAGQPAVAPATLHPAPAQLKPAPAVLAPSPARLDVPPLPVSDVGVPTPAYATPKNLERIPTTASSPGTP